MRVPRATRLGERVDVVANDVFELVKLTLDRISLILHVSGDLDQPYQLRTLPLQAALDLPIHDFVLHLLPPPVLHLSLEREITILCPVVLFHQYLQLVFEPTVHRILGTALLPPLKIAAEQFTEICDRLAHSLAPALCLVQPPPLGFNPFGVRNLRVVRLPARRAI